MQFHFQVTGAEGFEKCLELLIWLIVFSPGIDWCPVCHFVPIRWIVKPKHRHLNSYVCQSQWINIDVVRACLLCNTI